MKILVLTSSRADYGIYRPLLLKLHRHAHFDLQLIVFGTHLSHFHGYTITQIYTDGLPVAHRVSTLLLDDDAAALSTAMGLTTTKFSQVWALEQGRDSLVLALGDRYEMFAAVSAAVPFNIPIAHLHGGETTLGAIDNVFRHAISVMSRYHFTATQAYANKVAQLIGTSEGVYNVGALSLDNLQLLNLLNHKAFYQKYDINLQNPSILITFHPETVGFEQNEGYVKELIAALQDLSANYQLIITMPNADTLGTMIRKRLNAFIKRTTTAYGIESFGTLGYFSCMQHCSFLLGNTSSGIIEAASFAKYVINIGERQRGRACGNNVLQVPIRKNEILKAVQVIEKSAPLTKHNMYWRQNVADQIVNVLNDLRDKL